MLLHPARTALDRHYGRTSPERRYAADWRVTGMAKICAPLIPLLPVGPVAGFWLFAFESMHADANAIMAFVGCGPKLTWQFTGGISIPVKVSPPSLRPEPGHRLHCRHPFRLCDLSGASGLISERSLAVGVGYGTMTISAGRASIEYFRLERMSGWSLGLGLGAASVPGFWAQTNLGC